jgi:hypothetical protein
MTHKSERREDLETEKLIVGKNVHSVVHMCPKHGTSCYTPLSNGCEDCKLYLSGADIRTIIEAELKRQRDEIREWAKNDQPIDELYSEEEHRGFVPAYPVVFYNDLIALLDLLEEK